MYVHQFPQGGGGSRSLATAATWEQKARSQAVLYLFPHLSTDLCQSFLTVEALGLDTAVAEHLQDLGVFYRSVESIINKVGLVL